MKQKITLEIDNDTGVEFEEFIERRKVVPGEYWFGENRIVGPAKDGVEHYGLRYVLTPKADHELEEAKKLIGKWVKNDRSNNAMKVTRVYRDEHCGDIVYANESSSASAKHWKPFPLPTWRCCEADRPKKEGYYFLRNKTTKEGDYVFFDRHYRKSMIWHNYEWLDEGER